MSPSVQNLLEHRLRSWLLLSAAFVLVAGCSYPTSSPVAFDVQVREWVPIGTDVADAARTMEGRRFHVVRLHPEEGSEDQRERLFCSRKLYFFPLFDRQWQVILKIEEERIADVQTNIFRTSL